MPTLTTIRRGIRDRSMQARTQAADKREISHRAPLTLGERVSGSPKSLEIQDSGNGKTVLTFPKNHTIFSQGDAADAVFHIQAGRVKLTVVSSQGKEAVVAILERGAFLGESCLAGQLARTATATVLEDSTLVRLHKAVILPMLHEEPAFAEQFMGYLLTHAMRIQEDLVDQLFNSSEKRLARVLLSLGHDENGGQPETVIPRLSQETLAERVGTTRSRINFFMNKFRKLGFIDYGYSGEIRIHNSLPTVLLHD
jgi:CRP/FNR family cyclic AMP-dependent transcriptional regulator